VLLSIKNYSGIIRTPSWSGGQNIANLQSLSPKCTLASFPITSFQQESSLENYIQLSVMLEYNHWLFMLSGSTVYFWVARYSRVHVPQPSTRKTFSLLDAYWSTKESLYHPMHLPIKTNVPSIYMPCTFQQPSLVPWLFFRNETTMHLPFTYICHAHPTGWHIC